MYACVAYPNPESVGFHERMGFKTIGHFNQCGFKCKKWLDMIWMEKMLGDHSDNPEPVIPFSEIKSKLKSP
jgi:L-amino acid N-acyltransferase YncA